MRTGHRGHRELPCAADPSDRLGAAAVSDDPALARVPQRGRAAVRGRSSSSAAASPGVQIAEELSDAGRQVFLSVGSAGRVPRRYRGADIFHWLATVAAEGEAVGSALPTVDKLPDPRMRVAGNPHLSGHRGGHEVNLRRLASDGMTLLGRIEAVDGTRLRLQGRPLGQPRVGGPILRRAVPADHRPLHRAGRHRGPARRPGAVRSTSRRC